MAKTVADQFIETVAAAGVKRVYGIVGDSLNGLTDAVRRQGSIDATEMRRRRLLFCCWHRGIQEIDLILGSFAETFLVGFDDAQLDRFAALLDCADADLFDWITGRTEPPLEYDHDVMRLVRSFRYGQRKG
jgi:antitoxin CptB